MEEINLEELFYYFRNKISWIIIAIILAIGIGNTFTILTRTPMYKSSTTMVLVNENKDSSTYNTTEQQLNKNLVGTYSEIIKSRMILETVISNLKLDYTSSELASNISVDAVDDTEIIQVSVSDANAKEATSIANEIAKVFMEKIQKIYNLNNVSIIDKAEDSIAPYNVNYLKDNAIYILVGLVLSCGTIFIFFYFDTTIKSSEEIESKLGLNVIGSVPKVGKE